MVFSSFRLKKSDFSFLRFGKISGRNFFSQNFSLKILHCGWENSRFGVLAGSSVSKMSTARNKVKRRVREVIRSFLPEFKEGYAVIIYVKKGAAILSFREIKEELAGLFKKSKILN